VGIDVERCSASTTCRRSSSNAGRIAANATRQGAYGYASAIGVSVMAMYSELYNTGSIDARRARRRLLFRRAGTGVQSFAKYGVVAVNEGSIHAQASTSHGGQQRSDGLIGSAYYGDASLYNTGEISADALAEFDGSLSGSAYALGVLLHGDYCRRAVQRRVDQRLSRRRVRLRRWRAAFVGTAKYDLASLTNAGDIVAIADAAGGYATAQAVRFPASTARACPTTAASRPSPTRTAAVSPSRPA
jgi:hypothetical protein